MQYEDDNEIIDLLGDDLVVKDDEDTGETEFEIVDI